MMAQSASLYFTRYLSEIPKVACDIVVEIYEMERC